MSALPLLALATWLRQSADEPPADYLIRSQRYVATLVELGALTPREGDRWLARFRRAAADDRRPVPEVAEKARTLLERNFDELPPHVQPGDEEVTRYIARTWAIDALRVLRANEMREWQMRVGEKITVATGIAAVVDEPQGRARETRAAARPQGRLKRVLGGPPDRVQGLRVASVELYEDAVGVNWHFTANEHDAWPERPSYGGHVTLTDDRDTRYIPVGHGGTRLGIAETGPTAVRGQDTFVPGAPREAQVLSVHYRAEAIDVPVTP